MPKKKPTLPSPAIVTIASFKTGDMYDHHDADGFINLFGLSLKVRAMKKLENEKKNNK